MKSILLKTLLLFTGIQLLAQCPEEQMDLDRRSKAEYFFNTYPNCTEINGSVLSGDTWSGDIINTRFS